MTFAVDSQEVNDDILCVQPTPPPSEKALYESTVVWTDVDDPDQAFSLLGSLCEAGVETNNPCDFIFRAFFILSGTCKYLLKPCKVRVLSTSCHFCNKC